MASRPDRFSVFAIAVVVASLANLAVVWVLTRDSRAVVDRVVAEGAAEGAPTHMPRPTVGLDDAIRKGNVEAVRQHMYWCLREKRCDLDRSLALAAASKNPVLTQVLLAAGARPDRAKGKEGTALHAAAASGKAPAGKALLQSGADADARDASGRTPLHAAAAWGNVEMVRVLLASGADPNAKDRSGQTPLHLVASRPVPPLSAYAAVTRALLAAGARPAARADDGSTPLALAQASSRRVSLDGNVKATADANEVVTLLGDRASR